MKKNCWPTRIFALLVLCAALSTTAALGAEAGSPQDPLVTLSYLNDTFLNTVLTRVDEKIALRNSQLPQGGGGSFSGSGSSASFTVVTLSEGQTLTGGIGCEVMLRVGSAVCVSPSSPGLIDETSGGTLNSGSGLSQNHLYMMTIDNRGVRATAATTKLLVRGSYTVSY